MNQASLRQMLKGFQNQNAPNNIESFGRDVYNKKTFNVFKPIATVSDPVSTNKRNSQTETKTETQKTNIQTLSFDELLNGPIELFKKNNTPLAMKYNDLSDLDQQTVDEESTILIDCPRPTPDQTVIQCESNQSKINPKIINVMSNMHIYLKPNDSFVELVNTVQNDLDIHLTIPSIHLLKTECIKIAFKSTTGKVTIHPIQGEFINRINTTEISLPNSKMIIFWHNSKDIWYTS